MYTGITEFKPVRIYGDPALRVQCEEVEDLEDEDVHQAIAELVVAHKKSLGVGLAAPQIGRTCRVFVMRDESIPGHIRICVNPKILEQRGEQLVPEACLSIPGVTATIKRPKQIVLQYTNVGNEEVVIDAFDMAAAVVCHEIDHLDGKLFIDQLSPTRRKRVMKPFQKRQRLRARTRVTL